MFLLFAKNLRCFCKCIKVFEVFLSGRCTFKFASQFYRLEELLIFTLQLSLLLFLLHVYTCDLPTTTVDIKGRPVITKC